MIKLLTDEEMTDDSDEELYIERVIRYGYIGNIIYKLSKYQYNINYRKGFRLAKKILLLIRQLYKFFFKKKLNLNWLFFRIFD